MQYNLIQFDTGIQLLQEIHDGAILRYCDLKGSTSEPPLGSAKFIKTIEPAFKPPEPPRIEAPVEAPAALEAISRLQAKLALAKAGLLPKIEAFMEAEPVDSLARLSWENAGEFRRDSEVLNSLAGALGLSQAQLDTLFASAAAIEV